MTSPITVNEDDLLVNKSDSSFVFVEKYDRLSALAQNTSDLSALSKSVETNNQEPEPIKTDQEIIIEQLNADRTRLLRELEEQKHEKNEKIDKLNGEKNELKQEIQQLKKTNATLNDKLLEMHENLQREQIEYHQLMDKEMAARNNAMV